MNPRLKEYEIAAGKLGLLLNKFRKENGKATPQRGRLSSPGNNETKTPEKFTSSKQSNRKFENVMNTIAFIGASSMIASSLIKDDLAKEELIWTIVTAFVSLGCLYIFALFRDINRNEYIIILFVSGLFASFFLFYVNTFRTPNFAFVLGSAYIYQFINFLISLLISKRSKKLFTAFVYPTFLMLLLIVSMSYTYPLFGVDIPYKAEVEQYKKIISEHKDKVLDLFDRTEDTKLTKEVVVSFRSDQLANIRSEPFLDRTDNNIIGSVEKGSVLIVLGEATDYDGSGRLWYKIKIPKSNRTGWICKGLTREFEKGAD